MINMFQLMEQKIFPSSFEKQPQQQAYVPQDVCGTYVAPSRDHITDKTNAFLSFSRYCPIS